MMIKETRCIGCQHASMSVRMNANLRAELRIRKSIPQSAPSGIGFFTRPQGACDLPHSKDLHYHPDVASIGAAV